MSWEEGRWPWQQISNETRISSSVIQLDFSYASGDREIYTGSESGLYIFNYLLIHLFFFFFPLLVFVVPHTCTFYLYDNSVNWILMNTAQFPSNQSFFLICYHIFLLTLIQDFRQSGQVKSWEKSVSAYIVQWIKANFQFGIIYGINFFCFNLGFLPFIIKIPNALF